MIGVFIPGLLLAVELRSEGQLPGTGKFQSTRSLGLRNFVLYSVMKIFYEIVLTMYSRRSSFAPMKKVLSLLVAFVFLQVQSWALSGGPVFAGSTAAVKGTYAGSLIPSTAASNSLGIFALGVPTTGLASGIFALFVSGGAYYGSMVGVIDPDKLTLNALAQASQSETAVQTNANGTTTIVTIPVGLASGLIRATLKQQTSNGFSSSGGTGAYRLTGSGSLQTFTLPTGSVFVGGGAPVPGAVINLTVDGFQQSTTVDSTINLNTLTGTQSSSTGS